MVKKKASWVIVIAAVVLIAIVVIIMLRGPEDSWIKDSRGVWVKHGAPADTPNYVSVQQETIDCANGLYEEAVNSHVLLKSQCLGTCGDYAIDLVNVPRTEEDDLQENQCDSYRLGQTKHFIEYDQDGGIVRAV